MIEPQLSIYFIRPILQYLERKGHTGKGLLDTLGLAEIELGNDKAFIPFSRTIDVVRRASEIARVNNAGLYIYEEFDLTDYGQLGYVLLTSDSLLSGFRELTDLSLLVDEATQIWLEETENTIKLNFTNSDQQFVSNRFDIIHSLMFLIAYIRKYIDSNWNPLQLDFQFDPPSEKELKEYEEVLRAPMRFSQPVNTMVSDIKTFKLQLPYADKNLFKLISDDMHESIEAVHKQRHFLSNLRKIIKELLPEGASIEAVAAKSGISPRSLQRQIQACGYQYRDLLGYVRMQKAIEYLRLNDKSVHEISMLLGYAEDSSFIHAFQRWSGTSPKSYAKKLGSFVSESISL